MKLPFERIKHLKEPIFIKNAKERYPQHFQISEMVINQLHEWIDRTDIPVPQTALGIVKFASVIRAFNLYRSINVLLETDHWEDAAVLSRSMFELLLNLEEIVRDKEGAENKAKKYLRFQKLQEHLHQISLIDYEVQTGRRSKEQVSKLTERKKMTKSIFTEFLSKRKGPEWETSWCGKNVYKLANDSANPMRIPQYKIIYSLFSDFSHSSPYSVMTTMALGNTPEETEKIFQSCENAEKRHMTLVLTLSTTWLLETLFIGRYEIPLYDVKWNFEVLKRIYKCYVVESPKLPWE
jgi:hypothetical protein